jgi:hypothetical protein
MKKKSLSIPISYPIPYSLSSLPTISLGVLGGLYGLGTQVDRKGVNTLLDQQQSLVVDRVIKGNSRRCFSQSDSASPAASFLALLGGNASTHIKMKKNIDVMGSKKYTTVKKRLTAKIAQAHIDGTTCLGSNLHHDHATAVLFVFDADTGERWDVLCHQAGVLADAGARPFLEESPHRGGHMGVIFDAPVSIDPAFATIFKYAPQLAELDQLERFPTQDGARVRLPAGHYDCEFLTDPDDDPDHIAYRYVVEGWCQVQCVGARDDTWYTGHAAVEALMEHLTPANWVTVTDATSTTVSVPAHQEAPSLIDTTMMRLTEFDEQCQALDDSYWLEHYGESRKYLPFWATAEQTIRWFNSRKRVQDLVRQEKNKFVLAFWRNERTASVWLYPETNTWHDFGEGGRRADGTKDGGDAFELYCRANNCTRSQALKQAFTGMASEAEQHLRRARRSGLVPQWVAEIVPPQRRRG